jgi:hypothetical protein
VDQPALLPDEYDPFSAPWLLPEPRQNHLLFFFVSRRLMSRLSQAVPYGLAEF